MLPEKGVAPSMTASKSAERLGRLRSGPTVMKQPPSANPHLCMLAAVEDGNRGLSSFPRYHGKSEMYEGTYVQGTFRLNLGPEVDGLPPQCEAGRRAVRRRMLLVARRSRTR